MALDGPRYCDLCEMWLNGDAQYYRHLRCKIHKSKLRGKRVQTLLKDNEGHSVQWAVLPCSETQTLKP